MNLSKNNIYFIIVFIILITLLLIYLFFKYKKNRILEMSKLNYLFLDFKKEKIISKKLNNSGLKVKKIQRETQIKLNKLNVSIVNINFSLIEIFK